MAAAVGGNSEDSLLKGELSSKELAGPSEGESSETEYDPDNLTTYD